MNQKTTSGFVLPAAIFVLVILAALGVYAVNISSIQQQTSIQDAQGTRGYHAARAGMEWGIYQVLSPGTTTLAACPPNNTLVIESFSVSITCNAYGNYNEQGTDHTIAVYQLISTATFGTAGSLNYIERQLQVLVNKCRGTDASVPYECN